MSNKSQFPNSQQYDVWCLVFGAYWLFVADASEAALAFDAVPGIWNLSIGVRWGVLNRCTPLGCPLKSVPFYIDILSISEGRLFICIRTRRDV